MKMPGLLKVIIACLALLMLSQNSLASAESDDWVFEVTPYFLAASLDGEAGFGGVTADVDMSFSDIWDTLDSAFMGLVTAEKDKWIFGFETVYFKISDEGAKAVSGSFGEVTVDGALELTTAMTVYQATAGYRIYDDETTVDLLGGIRYTELDLDADVVIATTPGIIFPGGARSFDDRESWNDAVIGLRVLHPVSDDVDLFGYVDVGGGESDGTYQLIGGVDWEFKEDYTAKVGYRILDWDYDDNDTKWDMEASGIYMGLGIRF